MQKELIQINQKNKIKTMNKQKQSQSTHQNTQSRDSRNPQKSISIRKAAAKLKEKQTQLDIIKKRFLVLKGQQDYNRYRTLDQQRRINHHYSLHQSLKSDRHSLQKQLNKQRQHQEKQLKQRHDKIQQEIKDSSQQAINQLYASRINQRNKLKELSKNNQSIIQKNRTESIQENARKKDKIISEQNRQKILVNQFKNSHIKDTIGNRSMQASRLIQITQAKDKQLQKLMTLQQQMLKKASQSIAMNQKLKGQYGKVFVQVKQRNYVKFPSISRQSGSYRSNHSNLSRNLSIYQI